MDRHFLVEETLTRGVERIYPNPEAFRAALQANKKLRFYLGIDPTSAHLHLGHAAPLFFLRRLQQLGHEVILLIGDFTARIGDPTDKLAARQPMTAAQVKKNCATFKQQAAKIISFSGTNAAKLMFNSRWLSKLKSEDVLALAGHFTVQQLEAREMFVRRREEQKPISASEFFYPLLQGYDSVAMEVDGEVGGNDQTFNMLIGRDLLKELKNKEKFVVAMKLIVDPTTGKKLSKTEDALVNLDDSPKEMFGKLMAVPDGMIVPIAESCTDLPVSRVQVIADALKSGSNPKNLKQEVAEAFTALFHGEKVAEGEKRRFEERFSKKKVSEEDIEILDLGNFVKEFYLDFKSMGGVGLAYALVSAPLHILPSNSEVHRRIAQRGIKVNGKTATDPKMIVKLDDVISVGKRRIVRVKF